MYAVFLSFFVHVLILNSTGAYYAAQVGISIKARDTPSRELLFSLLTVLERMKNEIGPTDAIDMEEASAAYVENFALKVFAMADNEDRAGRSTRSVHPCPHVLKCTSHMNAHVKVNGQKVPRSGKLPRSS